MALVNLFPQPAYAAKENDEKGCFVVTGHLHRKVEIGVKQDFVEKFGWIMREVYCGNACPDRFDCQIAQEFIPDKTDSIKT